MMISIIVPILNEAVALSVSLNCLLPLVRLGYSSDR